MKKVSEARMAAQFSDYLGVSQEEPIVVTRKGKAVAVLVAVRNEADAKKLASKPPRTLRSILEEANAQLERGERIPSDEFWKQVAEMRKEQRKSKRAPAAKSG